MIIILLIFMTSFLGRFAIDQWLIPHLHLWPDFKCINSESGYKMFCSFYNLILFVMITQYIYDLFPIGAIVMFHYFNFREVSNNAFASIVSENDS